MAEFGHFALCLGWLLALTGVVTGVVAGKKRRTSWFLTARNATIASGTCTFVSLLALAYCFVTDDYRLQYVWQFSQRDMPVGYKVTAIWGGMDGSMLLWCGALGVIGAIVAVHSTGLPRLLMPWVLSAVNSSSLFFLTIVVFLTNPFRYLPVVPPDGNGLNPLLQNPYMAIHPPMLYLGFTTLAVPYSFCMGALMSGVLSNDWIRLTRRWTLISWGFLTAGICLGGYWAYIELGWGGFWAWDPVENASFMPWLTATAFLHSVMVQERKNMLKVWNIWLIVLSYGLTVFGTFLTRSGVVQSVHAFASTDVGWVFLTYLGFVFFGALVLTLYRRRELQSERKIDSFISRESAFLLNNLLLLSICFATLWGVLFPVFSEYLTGERQTVGIPFFNAVNVPLFLLLILLMGVGPLIAWKRANWMNIRRSFLMPALIGLLAGMAILWAGVRGFYPVMSYSLSVFVFMTIIMEFYRGVRSQRVSGIREGVVSGTTRLLRRHRTRYGGYLIHFGVLVAAVAITASMAHKVEREISVSKGEEYSIGRFRFLVDDVQQEQRKNYVATVATVILFDRGTGERLGVLHPEQRFYPRGGRTRTGSAPVGEWTSEVALRKSLREDFYLVLAGVEGAGDRVALKVYLNPLQSWLWIGVAIMTFGTFVVLQPRRRTDAVRIPPAAQVAGDA